MTPVLDILPRTRGSKFFSISIDPDVLVGKPTIKGTRLAIDFIIELLTQGWSNDDILRNYPDVSIAGICFCYLLVEELPPPLAQPRNKRYAHEL